MSKRKAHPQAQDAPLTIEQTLADREAARIMAGDVDHIDHAHDIAGYATLYVRACGARHAERAATEALAELEAAMAAPRYAPGDVTVTLVNGAAAA